MFCISILLFQVLRLMKGYDEYNTILLPPRNPGDRLPNELLDYFEGNIYILLEAELYPH